MHALPLRRLTAGTLVFLFPLTVLAATRTWDAGGADNNWSTAANWSDNTVPTASDIALFDGTGKKNATIDAAFGGSVAELRLGSSNTGTITAVRSLTVNGNVSLSGGTLAINGGNTMTVQKSWQNDGNATFTSNTGTVLLTGSGTSYILKESNAFKHLSLDDGLVGHWRFDESTGTGAIDSGRAQIHGMYKGGASRSTSLPTLGFQNTTSANFDGVNDYIETTTLGTFGQILDTGPLAVSAWFNMSSIGVGGAAILGSLNTGSNTGLYLYIFPDGSIQWFIRGQGEYHTYINVAPTSPVADGTWHHIVALKTGTTASSMAVYIDGVLQAVTGSRDDGPGQTTTNLVFPLYIGMANSRGTPLWGVNGQMDDVRIYSRALSHSEIQSLYAGNQGTGSGKYTLGSAISVNGDLTVYSGTLDTSSSNYGITASGSFVNNATFVPRSATVTLSGIATTLKMYGTSLYNLTIASAKSAILRTAAAITNAITVASSAAFNLNGFDLTATVASISNLGTITEGTGAILHTSSLSASPASLAIGSSISITLTDSDANLDGTARETVTVSANGETITLTETTNTSGIFQGSVSTAHGAGVASNGIIENDDACSFFVNVAYSDPQDGTDRATAQVTVTDAGVPCEIGGGGGGGGSRGGVQRLIEQAVANRSSAAASSTSSVSSSVSAEPDTHAAVTRSSFSDVSPSAWFFVAVKELASLGIVSGYKDAQGNPLNRFGPADSVTFAETIKMILGVSGADIPQGGVPSDIALRTHWSSAYLSYAETLGLTLFPTAVTIDLPISRGELAQLLADILGSPSSGDELSFTDVASSHDHAAAIRIAAAQGWMMGDTDADGALLHRFRPDDSLNRAEVTQVLVRVMAKREE